MSALHNFIKGIDWVTDPTGATPLANHIFIAKGGSDATITGNFPDTPYLTINAARAANGSNKTYVVGAGIYSPSLLPDATYVADGLVILDGGGTLSLTNSIVTFSMSDFFIVDYLKLNNTLSRNPTYTNVGFIRTDINIGSGSSINQLFTRCFFYELDLNLGAANGTITIERSVFNNCASIGFNNTVGSVSVFFNHNHVDALTTIDASAIVGTLNFSYNNNNGTLLGVPTVNTGNINVDPLFIGDNSNLELIVEESSPLIGGGLNGLNIGNIKTGVLQNELTTEWGTTPFDAGNTSFDVDGQLYITSGTSSARESTSIDLGKLISSPTVRYNGLSDYVSNVPDFNNALIKPNQLTFEAQYAGLDGVFNGVWLSFRYNFPMNLDLNGRSSGDELYSFSGIVDISMRYVKIRTTLRNDYNPS